MYTKQRIYRVFLLGKTKKAFYKNLDVRKVSDKRYFCKTVKHALPDKFNAGKG